MPVCVNFIIGIIIFSIIAFIQIMVGTKKPFKKTISSVLLGVISLIAVNISGIFTGVTIPVSNLSLMVSAILGIPGTILILALNMVL